MQQLRDTAGIPFVRSFKMSNRKDVTDYFLVYGTRNLTGLKKMKEAMWKVDESGEFRFSDATDQNQMVLFDKTPDLKLLRAQIVQRFATIMTTRSEIEKFVVADTAFRESHYKGILKALEENGQLDVISAKPGRKRGTFGDPDMVICISRRARGHRRFFTIVRSFRSDPISKFGHDNLSPRYPRAANLLYPAFTSSA